MDGHENFNLDAEDAARPSRNAAQTDFFTRHPYLLNTIYTAVWFTVSSSFIFIFKFVVSGSAKSSKKIPPVFPFPLTVSVCTNLGCTLLTLIYVRMRQIPVFHLSSILHDNDDGSETNANKNSDYEHLQSQHDTRMDPNHLSLPRATAVQNQHASVETEAVYFGNNAFASSQGSLTEGIDVSKSPEGSKSPLLDPAASFNSISNSNGHGRRAFSNFEDELDDTELREIVAEHQRHPMGLSMSKLYLSHFVPISLAVAIEVGCNNASLQKLDITIYTICKGASPICILIAAILYKLDPFQWASILSISVICLGTISTSIGTLMNKGGGLDVHKDGSDNALGLVLIFTSICVAGFRWVRLQLLLQHIHAKIDPLLTIIHTSPLIVVFMTPIALGFELHPFLTWLHSPASINSNLSNNSNLSINNYKNYGILGIEGPSEYIHSVYLLPVLVLALSVLLFALLNVEYCLVRRVSSVSLSIVGVAKELLTIALGILIFRDSLNSYTIIGFIVTHIGIFLYIVHKHRSESQQTPAQRSADDSPFIVSDIN